MNPVFTLYHEEVIREVQVRGRHCPIFEGLKILLVGPETTQLPSNSLRRSLTTYIRWPRWDALAIFLGAGGLELQYHQGNLVAHITQHEQVDIALLGCLGSRGVQSWLPYVAR